MTKEIDIRPQPGKQEEFLRSSADIVIFGGAAFGGKTYALLLEILREHENPNFNTVIFRRNSPQLTGAGSVWEKAKKLYKPLGANFTKSPTLLCVFPSGAMVQFLHLQYDDTVDDHQGKEYALQCWDELTHFTYHQWQYMVSRMRSTSGVKPYMRCTCNPDPDSFVRKLIDWWIGPDGYPIDERSGVLRYFVHDGDEIVWSNTAAELEEKYPEKTADSPPLSLTFIPAKIEDNPIGMKEDPSYRSKLESMGEVDRAHLLLGNWDARPSGGDYLGEEDFHRRWAPHDPIILALEMWRKDPANNLCPLNIYGASDYAVTEYDKSKRAPDFTEHGVFGVDRDGMIYVLDWWYGQTKSGVWIDRLLDLWAKWQPIRWFGEEGVIRKAVEPLLERRSRDRGIHCPVEYLPTLQALVRDAALHTGYRDPSKRAKAIRCRSFQGLAQAGKVMFPEDRQAAWVARTVKQITQFPVGHDDAFDVCGHFGRGIDKVSDARPLESPVYRYDPYEMWSEEDGSFKTV